MAAAYAALVSLVNTIYNIQNHSRLSNSLDNIQIQSLSENFDFLLDFVEENHHSDGGAQVLESQITSLAHAAEDVIESHIVDRIEPLLAPSTTFEKSYRSLLNFLLNMMQLIENRPSLLISPDRMQIQTLGEKIDFWLDVMDSHVGNKEAGVLENQLAPEALVIKDAIKSQIRGRFESRWDEIDSDDKEISSSFMIDLLFSYMEQILNHPTAWTSLDSTETELCSMDIELLRYLTDPCCNSDGIMSEEEEDLKSENAEYAIESLEAESTSAHGETSSMSMKKEINAMKKKVIRVSKKIFGKKAVFAGSENSFLPDLQKILGDMESVKERAIKLREARGFKHLPHTYSISAAYLTTRNTKVVGFESYILQLLDRLTTEQSQLQIIPITGMGGIGKTTLARKVYDDLLVVQHFDIRIWLTVSQDYNVRDLLFHTLSPLVECPDDIVNKTEGELGVLLHKILYGRRYLIILDDM